MNYRAEVERTLNPDTNGQTGEQLLAHAALGLAGEAGEVADLIKKVIYHHKPLNREELIKEMGDCMWYLEALMIAVGTDRAEVEAVNVEKLKLRYPDGFSYEAANNRADENNQQVPLSEDQKALRRFEGLRKEKSGAV